MASSSEGAFASTSKGQSQIQPTDTVTDKLGSGDLVGEILRSSGSSSAKVTKISSGSNKSAAKSDKKANGGGHGQHGHSTRERDVIHIDNKNSSPIGTETAMLRTMHREMLTMQQASMASMQKSFADSCATMAKSLAETFAMQLGAKAKPSKDPDVHNQSSQLPLRHNNKDGGDSGCQTAANKKRRVSDTQSNTKTGKRQKLHEVSDDEGELPGSESDHDVNDNDSEADIEAFMVENREGDDLQPQGQVQDASPDRSDGDDDLDFIARDVEAQFELEEETGPDLNSSVMNMVQKLVQKTVPDSAMKAKLDKVKRPGNCDFLTTPKLNPEIWAVLKSGVRSKEIRAQKLQTKTVKAVTMLAETVNNITVNSLGKKAKPVDAKILVKGLFGVIGVLGSTFQDASQLRKEEIKPVLPPKFKPLCNAQVPVTSKLFGDDLAKAVKDLNETSRLSQNLTNKNPPKGKSKYSLGKGKAFLGYRRPGHLWNSGHANNHYQTQRYHNSHNNNHFHKKKQEAKSGK